MNFVQGTKLHKNEFVERRGWDELGELDCLYIYTLPSIKEVATGKLLHSTGSSAQCSVVTQRRGVGVVAGQMFKREGYICMGMCICMCTRMCVCVYVCICMCMCVFICMCMCVYVCVHICVYVYVYICMCVCMCMCIFICMCMFICMCVYMYMYVYMYS